MTYETNIYKIENLHEFSSDYLLYEILGLNNMVDDYDINIQYLIKTLSYSLKHPVTFIVHDEKPCLVIKDDPVIISKVPAEFAVKGNEIVYFKKVDTKFTLDFVNYTDETKPIILRFLQFDIQTELNKNSSLWQPGSGDAFFSQDGNYGNENVTIYNGFFVRVVELPGGGFGFSVDITKKYIATRPLDVHLTRNEFKNQKINTSHLLYRYGNKRYEIKADRYNDLNASQYKYKNTAGELISLLQDTQERFGKSMPPEVASLPDDSAVISYRTNTNEERSVIAGLCYKVYDTEDPNVKKLHKKSIVKPFFRRKLINIVRYKFLSKLMYGTIQLKISALPIQVKKRKFLAPDILFGNDALLSVRGTEGAINTIIEQLGHKRKSLLFDLNAGFYTNAPFQTQYFVVPLTIYNMYGNEQYFIRDLVKEVNLMHPTENGWLPEVIVYDNRNKKNCIEIGMQIIDKISKANVAKNGYAVIMLPSNTERVKREHDQLAALVVSECHADYNMTVSIMHSGTLEDCFIHNSSNGKSSYSIKNEKRGKYSGYVKGVAINQILLNNERWPFVLDTPLNADLTIGIDVKKQMAGFTFIDKYSKNILTKSDKSQNKEKLSIGQITKMLVETIQLLASKLDYPLERIVIHRDGRLFKSEKEGIMKAISTLQKNNILSNNASVSIIEIPKHSIIPFRLFEIVKNYNIISQREDNGAVLNPEIGSYVTTNDKDGFICTTGKEFSHDGSSNPLYVKYESGTMEFDEILEDLYYLSCLAYTKPDDCSRFPLTIKITDRRINNLGSYFDYDSLDLLKSEAIN